MDEVERALGQSERDLDHDVALQRPLVVAYVTAAEDGSAVEVEYVRADVYEMLVAAVCREPSLVDWTLRDLMRGVEDERGAAR